MHHNIKEEYSGIQDGTPVTTMPYIPMDITDDASVEKVMREVNPDVMVHCAAWTAVEMQRMKINRQSYMRLMQAVPKILQRCVKN